MLTSGLSKPSIYSSWLPVVSPNPPYLPHGYQWSPQTLHIFLTATSGLPKPLDIFFMAATHFPECHLTIKIRKTYMESLGQREAVIQQTRVGQANGTELQEHCKILQRSDRRGVKNKSWDIIVHYNLPEPKI